MNTDIAEKLRTLRLGQRQDLLLRNPSLSDPEPTPQALDALNAATAAAMTQNEEAPPLGQQRRGDSLNDQHQPDKGRDMDNQPSNPSVTETLHLGEEQGPRRIGLDIDPSQLRYDGTVYTVAMTAAEARQTAWLLLDMATDVERIAATQSEQTQPSALETALALEAAGVSVIPIGADGEPAIDNWEEYQHRRATPDEIRAWFGPDTTPGAP